ncbi:hypothetical protein FPSE5266_07817 [Fusarium pseudograminearum]|nr:hypothetical protein FPSE5266_07817 [Fusarium pseudograminearum]
MSSSSPQVKVPDLYRSSPASAMQIRSVSGMWPSQLFADAVPRSWSKNVLVSLAKIISSASTKADTTVDDVVAWFKDNAESCDGLNQEACTQADQWLKPRRARALGAHLHSQREFKRVEKKLVMLGAERATLDQSVRDLTLDKERCDVYLGMVEYGPDGLATLREDVGSWKGMLDLV